MEQRSFRPPGRSKTGGLHYEEPYSHWWCAYLAGTVVVCCPYPSQRGSQREGRDAKIGVQTETREKLPPAVGIVLWLAAFSPWLWGCVRRSNFPQNIKNGGKQNNLGFSQPDLVRLIAGRLAGLGSGYGVLVDTNSES